MSKICKKKNVNFSDKSEVLNEWRDIPCSQWGSCIKSCQPFLITCRGAAACSVPGLPCLAWTHCPWAGAGVTRASAVPYSQQTLHFTSRCWAEGGSPHLLTTIASATGVWAGREMPKSCSSQEETPQTGSWGRPVWNTVSASPSHQKSISAISLLKDLPRIFNFL